MSFSKPENLKQLLHTHTHTHTHCKEEYKFTIIDAGGYGKSSDGGLLTHVLAPK